MKPRDNNGRFALENPSEVMRLLLERKKESERNTATLNAALRTLVNDSSSHKRTAELRETLKQARGEEAPETQDISLDDLLRRIVVGPTDTRKDNE